MRTPLFANAIQQLYEITGDDLHPVFLADPGQQNMPLAHSHVGRWPVTAIDDPVGAVFTAGVTKTRSNGLF